MWTGAASTCVTSSLFLTGLAPNILAVERARKTVQVDITWIRCFLSFLPAGAMLLLATSWITYKLYPLRVMDSPEVRTWARKQLKELGPLNLREGVLEIGRAHV